MKTKTIYELSGTIESIHEYDQEELEEDYVCYNCDKCILEVPAKVLYQDAYGNFYCEEKECVYEMLRECYMVEITDTREEKIEESTD